MEHTVIRSKRKTLSVEVDTQAQVIVRAPLHMAEHHIKRFIVLKQAWIKRVQSEMRKHVREYAPKRFVENEAFLFLGKTYTLKFVPAAYPIHIAGRYLLISKLYRGCVRAKLLQWYRTQARCILVERAATYAQWSGLQYTGLGITDARTRWGSCNHKNKINFAWRLIQAPLPVIDYVVVHELVHTIHKNHSQEYWNAVQQFMPDYKQYKRWLRDHNNELSFDIAKN